MPEDMLHVVEWNHGEKAFSPFSSAEMAARHSALRNWIASNQVDAALFTSQHCVAYYSGWLCNNSERRLGMVISDRVATTISAGIDGGQPWRRSSGENLIYTDWRRDNFFRAVRQLTPGVRRLGIEFDQVSIDFRRALDTALPGVEFVDIAQPALALCRIASAEEQALLRKGARIADLGARAAVAAIATGVPEHEVALAANHAMTCEIAASFPSVELSDSRVRLQSGINTDGAQLPVTNKRLLSGDILSLTSSPMIFGYSAALSRTLFCEHATEAALAIWEANLAVHRRCLALIRPGARCSAIAEELNALLRSVGLLQHRVLSYGHALGPPGPCFGRDTGIELREDAETALEPGMVLSVAPMLMLPHGLPGAGGYREMDMVIVTALGAEVLTRFPLGPNHNIIRPRAVRP